MQRGVTRHSGGPNGPRPCPHCGGDLVRSHRQYTGRGFSADVLRCRACGRTVTAEPRADAERPRANPGRSRRHEPVDEGPPSNPVLDPEIARRLLAEVDPPSG